MAVLIPTGRKRRRLRHRRIQVLGGGEVESFEGVPRYVQFVAAVVPPTTEAALIVVSRLSLGQSFLVYFAGFFDVGLQNLLIAVKIFKFSGKILGKILVETLFLT